MVTNIYFDVDGVLADLTGALAQELSAKTGQDTKAEHCTDYWTFAEKHPEDFKYIMSQESFSYRLPVYEHAQEHLEYLNSRYNVYYATKPYTSYTWCAGRTAWLEKHFNARKEQVIFISDKYLLRDGILIDDHDLNVDNWRKYHSEDTAILWPRLYNRRRREATGDDWVMLKDLLCGYVHSK